MAIAIGEINNPVSSAGAQTITFTITVAVGDVVIAYAEKLGNNTSATFDGNAMTVIDTTGTIFFGSRALRAWRYDVTSAGDFNCVIDNLAAATFRAGAFVVQGAASGLDSPTVIEAINSNVTSNTVTVVPSTNDAWAFVVTLNTAGGQSAGTGATIIGAAQNNMAAFRNGPINPAASTDLTYNQSSSNTAALGFALAPAGGGGGEKRSPIINVNQAVHRAAHW